MKIGNVELKINIILAPMAGVTDLPFRLIAEKCSPGLVCKEMVSSKALFYGDEKTKQLLKTDGEKRPISMQIFGSDTESMAFAAKYVSELADIVDINMGCPAPKVVKNGDGSKLLTDLEQAEKVIKAVVKNSKVPVTLKFRKGWDKENIVAVELAKIAEKAGVSAITIHGRTRTEFYSGVADLEIIKQVKQAVSIPVIGNGDVTDAVSAKKMMDETGCDGIMIGRASRGNPWIFKEITQYLDTGILPERPTNEEVRNTILRHAALQLEFKGEYTGIREMRKHVAWYTAGYPHSAKLRRMVNEMETFTELEESICNIFQ